MMQKKKIELPAHFRLRLLWLIMGILMMGMGLAVLIKLDLGTDPYSSFATGFSAMLHLSYGNGQLIAQGIMFIIIVLFGRKLIGIGMIANMVFVGYITDLTTYILDQFIDPGVWRLPAVRFGILLPVLAVFIVGAALYMAVDLGMSPFDGIPFVISWHLPKVSFRVIRMCWDLLFMTMGFFLGGTVGLITVLQALFLGPVITLVRKKIEPFLQ